MNGISVITQGTLTPRRFTCWTGREELKPAVQDLSGQLKPPTRSLSSSSDEDSPQAFLSERHNALTCRPFLTQRLMHRGSGYLTTQRVENPQYRQHVQKSARFRSRLNYTRSRSADHMVTPVASQSVDSDDLIGVHVTRSVDRSRDVGQMYSQPPSRLSHREHIPLPRPATTTGRYFDSSNGLCGRTAFQPPRRPQTAGSWLASGLKIQRIKLHSKNDFGVKMDVNSKDR